MQITVGFYAFLGKGEKEKPGTFSHQSSKGKLKCVQIRDEYFPCRKMENPAEFSG